MFLRVSVNHLFIDKLDYTCILYTCWSLTLQLWRYNCFQIFTFVLKLTFANKVYTKAQSFMELFFFLSFTYTYRQHPIYIILEDWHIRLVDGKRTTTMRVCHVLSMILLSLTPACRISYSRPEFIASDICPLLYITKDVIWTKIRQWKYFNACISNVETKKAEKCFKIFS